ncbi:MAG: creatininase [Firmicutes bacterium]|nr:creatininase [Bacillota bacterium]NBI62390.1 creatininase [Clostridiales bacterium]
MKSCKMNELTWPELKERIDQGAGIILPIGATEQHGEHLPICTDSYFAEEISLAVAEKTGMLVAPTITYGTNSLPLSGAGQGFIGTTSIDGDVFIRHLCNIVQEFIKFGFQKIVLYNWHGENASYVWESAWQATNRGTNKDVKLQIFTHGVDAFDEELLNRAFRNEFPCWNRDHAGILETSMMLYMKPEYVDESKYTDEISKEYPWWETLPIREDVITRSGSLWKESQSSAELGKEFLDFIVAETVKALNAEK